MDEHQFNRPPHNDGFADLPSDRDLPESASKKQGHNYLPMIALAGVASIAIIAVVMDGMNKSVEAPITTPEEISFKAPPVTAKPDFTMPEEPPENVEEALTQDPEMPPPAPANIDPVAERHRIAMEEMMAKEAMRIAQENRERQQERLQSPQVILDNSSPNTLNPASLNAIQPAAGADVVQFGGGSGSLAESGDPNLAFANQVSAQDVPNVKASRLDNLDWLIPQGTMIDGILETAIQSTLPGMTRAIVAQNIYSFDGSRLLIPKGSTLIGQYRSTVTRGQNRVFIVWTRMIRGDGLSIQLGSLGTDALGRSGLAGDVDTHFFERFGSSIMLSLIDTASQVAVNAADDENTANVALNGGQGFSNAADIALENSINIQPTIHIDQGSRIKVFVGQDLDFKLAAAGR